MGQIFSPAFDPILLPNETALLRGPSFTKEGQPVRCRWVGALPEYQKDFEDLTAAVWLTDQEDTNLELNSLELGQMRMRVLEDIKLRLNNPLSTKQWGTVRTRFQLSQFPTEPGQDWLKELLFRMSEFFVWEDETPRFDLYSADTVTISRVLFTGWKLSVEKIAKGELTSRQEIWVSGGPE